MCSKFMPYHPVTKVSGRNTVDRMVSTLMISLIRLLELDR